MRRTAAVAFFVWIAIGCVGCESCLDLDDYQLVPPGFVVGGGGSSTGTGTGTAGSGGEPVDPCESENVGGSLLVTLPVEPGGSARPCAVAPSSAGGIRVYALDPVDGECIAYGRIERLSGAETDAALRMHYRSDANAYVAGTFRGGGLEFPRRCSDNTVLELDLPAGAVEAIFVAQLRISGSTMCTQWIRTAGAPTGNSLSVSEVEADETGTVAIGGNLGGSLTSFDTGTTTNDVQGTAFYAHYRSDGTLDELVVFDGGTFDDVKGMHTTGGQWLITGTLQQENPDCHGCTGTSNVIDGAGDCAGGSGGAGGGAAGSGGSTGGAGGAGGAVGGGGAGPTGDTHNAFLWQRTSAGAACSPFDTYGSDRLASSDAQAGYDVSLLATSTACATYWTGMAGRDAWRFDATDPGTALFDAGGVSMDGFVMRLDGTSSTDCGPGTEHAWNVRLSPTPGSAVLWGNRIDARACSSGAIMTAFVNGAAQGRIALQRCNQNGTCDSSGPDIQLVNEESQLVIVGLRGDGGLAWHGVMGPTSATTVTLGGVVMGEQSDNFALDTRDDIVMALTTTGPLTSSNVETTYCPDMDEFEQPGTFLMRLGRDGDGGQAFCGWTLRVGP